MKISSKLVATGGFAIAVALTGCGSDNGGGSSSPWPFSPSRVQSLTDTEAVTNITPAMAREQVNVIFAAIRADADGDGADDGELFVTRPHFTGGPSGTGYGTRDCTAAGPTCTLIGPAGNRVPVDLTDENSMLSDDGVTQVIGTRHGVSLAQSRRENTPIPEAVATGLEAAGMPLWYEETDLYGYGGWMTHSAFFVGWSQLSGGQFDGVVVSGGNSLGIPSGSDPSGSGEATWRGVLIGLDPRANGAGQPGDVIQGDATVTITDLATPDVDVSFTGIRNIVTGHRFANKDWEDLSLTDGGFSGDGIEGSFYGTGHEEVGGVFDYDGLIGAFGAEREPSS